MYDLRGTSVQLFHFSLFFRKKNRLFSDGPKSSQMVAQMVANSPDSLIKRFTFFLSSIFLFGKKGADKSNSIDFLPPAHGSLTCDPTLFLQKKIIFIVFSNKFRILFKLKQFKVT